MRYLSTRGGTAPHSFSAAVAEGLAPDGGLFLPETLPDLRGKLEAFSRLGYAELCFEFLRLFATDIEPETLRPLVSGSYLRFADPAIAPLRRLGPGLHLLELFHGPTLAFKDFALQFLGNLYEEQCRSRKRSINVLGATSGDTGAAAISGLIGKPGTAIFILYPDGRVAPLQERQMACTGAANVFALAVDGDFDSAQGALKEVFGDLAFRAKRRLSAVNSINLARILAQSVYYLHAWLALPPAERAEAQFVVPTGNFGNVLSGWLLREMGVPIRSFRVATNQNDILYRLFKTGTYRIERVRPSLAPSMDIQVASNFERFLYYRLDKDPARVRATLDAFKDTGSCSLPALANGTDFAASRCTDEEIPGIIRSVYERYGAVIDPHTACGFKDLEPGRPSVVLATASPAKFPDAIRKAIGVEPTHPILEALKEKPIVKYPIKADPAAIKAFIEERGV